MPQQFFPYFAKFFIQKDVIYHYLIVCAAENITLSSPTASRYFRRKSHILYP